MAEGNMSIDQQEHRKESGGEDSMESSHEDTAAHAAIAAIASASQEAQPVQKRKGGRRPIYATSEERKQRNRQAQAAFRERRTEYIKQLEESIRLHEQSHAKLQALFRKTSEEVLMFRYKNSLLERILLEKGIDVKAELAMKEGSPVLTPAQPPHDILMPPVPVQRLSRPPMPKGNRSVVPKIEPGLGLAPFQPQPRPHSAITSPTGRPTSQPHATSPNSTNFGSSHGASPTSEHAGASSPPARMLSAYLRRQPLHPVTGMARARMQVMGHIKSPSQPAGGGGSQFYPQVSFQNHIKQLEREYQNTTHGIPEDACEPDHEGGMGSYPSGAYPHEMQQQLTPTTTGASEVQNLTTLTTVDLSHHSGTQASHGPYLTMSQLLSPDYEPDPFGLSAGMAFPNNLTFDTSTMK